MKIRMLGWLALSGCLLAASQVSAGEGYWVNSSGDIWRSGAGDCVHTPFWNMDLAVIGCDGKEAEVAVAAPPAAPVITAPEPAPAPVVQSVEDVVNFGFDRADLDTRAAAAIDNLVSQARSQGQIKAVRLTGHTDRVGTEAYNLDLSLRRAGSVNDYLVGTAGIDAQLIEMTGRGEAEPLAECIGVRGAAALECLAPNRRVDIQFDLF